MRWLQKQTGSSESTARAGGQGNVTGAGVTSGAAAVTTAGPVVAVQRVAFRGFRVQISGRPPAIVTGMPLYLEVLLSSAVYCLHSVSSRPFQSVARCRDSSVGIMTKLRAESPEIWARFVFPYNKRAGV